MGDFLWSHPWRTVLGLGAAATLIVVTGSAGPGTVSPDRTPTAVSQTAEQPSRQSDPESASGGGEQQAEMDKLLRSLLSRHNLAALIVRATKDGQVLYEGAAGETMTGVAATPQMHFRNGAVAFTYMSTILLKLVDDQKLHLHDKLSQYYPDLPHADAVTLKMLANMTAGYADYVYQPEILDGISRNPFQQWTTDELIRIGTSKPMMFEPGTNWGYSHTDYAILARVLEKASGVSMDQLMRTYIIDPLKLTQTQSLATPVVPEPVLHSFTSERRQALDIPAGTPFYEEATFWNPSWTTAGGAVQVSDIADVATSIAAVGEGTLLSSASHSAQVSPELAGFGKEVPGCAACRANTEAASYGLGVILRGPWITQDKLFAGAGAAAGYLPPEKLSIAVATTYASSAFDAEGNYVEADGAILAEVAKKLAPEQPIPQPEQ
ncbi:beta-lactamase family protein [Arthrobacter sp. I2-34]|uniref:Beta-lactamase family protein n=1 Tax=Arthrobacter hankyongi TaxID=2904801 RepID=A0ABS9LCI1_9MICC|nr:serine hydrolase domain-containing protein [Arthrobacter hankyongi]MCG2624384.1 beta-lactamase family protein [Arthrobacter hankyongi]